MLNAEAIKELSKAQAITAANTALQGTIDPDGIAALPNDYQVHDLEKMLQNRRRARGTMETYIIQAFADYTKAHSEEGASVFIDQDNMTAVSVLNLGTPAEPGHADNRAKLIAKRTAAYNALRAIANGQGYKQVTIAEFFEDWPGFLKFFNDSGEIAPPKAIAAVRKITVEALRKLETEEKQLSASRSAFESVSATSAEPIPTTIYFECEPYSGLAARTFVLRLAILTGNDKPAIALRVVKQEQHDEEMARELANLVGAAIVGMPVLIGKYSAST